MSSQILRCGGGFSKTVLLAMLLSCAVCHGQTNCDDLSDGCILTNPLQLASTLAVPRLQYPLVSPVLPTSFQPQAFWVADFASLGYPFAALTNYPGQDACGVTQYPLRLVCDVTSGVIVVEYPWSNNVELFQVNGPLTDQLASNYLATVRSWCVLHGINYTTPADLISNGVTFLEQPPELVLDAWVIAATDQAMYATNCAATPSDSSSGGSSSPAFGGGMFGMLFGTCNATTNTNYQITSIFVDSNQWVTITWAPTCSDDGFVYGVLSAGALSTNTIWTGIASMLGQNYTTAFTDMGSVGMAANYYMVMRLPADVGYNGDPITSGWVVGYGLNLFDNQLDWETPGAGVGYDYLQLYTFGADPTDPTTYPTNVPAFLAGQWQFDESAGASNTVDSSGNLNTGTLAGSPMPTWTTGIESNALLFTGVVSNNVWVADAVVLTPTQTITLVAWVKTSTNATGVVINKWATNNLAGSYSLALSNGYPVFELSQGGTFTQVVAASSVTDTNWHQVAGTYDGTQMVVYLDSVTENSASLTGSIDYASVPLLIGQLPATLDDVRIYSRALATNELNAIYNFSTAGDSIPDWWKLEYGFSLTSTNLAASDPDNSFWTALSDYQNSINPIIAADALPLSFIIDGGTNPVSASNLSMQMASGIIADYLIIAEDIRFTNCVTNTFTTSFNYSLVNTNDGLHTVFLQLLKASGPQSVVVGRSVLLDTHPPTISISSPSNGVTVATRRICIQGFAADAGTNPPTLDPSQPLLVTVNGNFVNDRGTNGLWWSSQNLCVGTNTVVAVATDNAGFSVTNSVWFIYDPTLSTNVPVITVDETNTVVFGSNTTTIAVSGTINNDNATVQIIVVDATDNTITNASVSVAVHGTNWWGEVPVVSGSNLVIIVAQNSASTSVTNTFTAIQNSNVYLAITGPAADTDINASNVTITGIASTNFNAAITINGQTAFTSNSPSGIFFSGTVPINNVDANIIEVDASGTDGSTATTRQIAYGYEVVSFQRLWSDQWQQLLGTCWYANHYPDTFPNYGNAVWDNYTWTGPSLQYSDTSGISQWSSSGNQLIGQNNTSSLTWDPNSLDTWDSGQVQYQTSYTSHHLDGGRFGTNSWEGQQAQFDLYDCPYDNNCTYTCPDGDDCHCHDLQYCLGDVTTSCCIDSDTQIQDIQYGAHTATFIKHWPEDEEQAVVLHFEDLNYLGGDTDVNQITLWGQPGFAYAVVDEYGGLQTNVGFWVKIKTNTPYTIHETDFTWPIIDEDSTDSGPNIESTVTTHTVWHQFGYYSFENTEHPLKAVNFVGSSNVMLTKGTNTFADFGDVPIDYPQWQWTGTGQQPPPNSPTSPGNANEAVCYIGGTSPEMQATLYFKGKTTTNNAVLKVKLQNSFANASSETVVLTKNITLTGETTIVSNLVWDTVITNGVGSYDYKLSWSLAMINKKGKSGGDQEFAKTEHNFLITLGAPETNGLVNAATVKRMTYAVTVAKGATDATTAANLIGPVATGGALFGPFSIFGRLPLDTAWEVMDGYKADCGTLSTLMKYELDLLGATGSTVNFVYACHADWSHLSSPSPDEFETDTNGNPLIMWFGNGTGAGTNNYEGCCVFQSMWWEGGNGRSVSNAYQVLLDSTLPNTNGVNSHQGWKNNLFTPVPYPAGTP